MSLSRLSNKGRIIHLLSKSRKCLTINLSTAAEETSEEVEYPPIKRKYPPGTWRVNRKTAWKRYDLQQKLLSLPTVKDRISYFRNLGTKEAGVKIWHYKPLCLYPNILDFQQDVTKSVLVEGYLPHIYDNIPVEEEVALLTPLIKEIIVAHHENINPKYFENIYLTAKTNQRFAKSVQRHFLDTLITVLSQRWKHIRHGVLAENVKIEAYWDRFGVERTGFKRADNSVYVSRGSFPTVEDLTYIPYPGFKESAELTSEFSASFQFRVEKPLPKFLKHGNNLCMEGEYPKCRYYLAGLGQRFSWKKLDIIAGFKPGSPFEFAHVSMLNTNHYEMMDYQRKVGEHHGMMARKGYGLNASFLLAVAQAYYQGFNTYIDVTYPFTTQTIVTDGKKFSFNAYQLNTLLLWKSDESHRMRNIWWHIPETDLYDVVENGEVKGFNDEVLKNIVKFFLLRPEGRDFNLKPTIPPESPDHIEKPDLYINEKREVIVEEQKVKFDFSK